MTTKPPRQHLAVRSAATFFGVFLLSGFAAFATESRFDLDSPPSAFRSDTIDFEELMDFQYERGKPIPQKIRKLDGKTVTIEGYMDTYTPENTRQFFLMSASCACDGEVELNHFVDVSLTSQVTGYRPGRLTVEGTFTVKEVEEDGFLISIFQIEGRITS